MLSYIILFIISSFLFVYCLKRRIYLFCVSLLSFYIYFLIPCFLNHPCFGQITGIPNLSFPLGIKETGIIALNLIFYWIFISIYYKKFTLNALVIPSLSFTQKIFFVAIFGQICYSLACFVYWHFVLHVPMLGWLVGDAWYKYRAFSNDFWNTGNVFFHLATYRCFLYGLGISHLVSAFVFLKKLRYRFLSVSVFLFQFFMVLHKSFIAELLLLATWIFIIFCCLNYKLSSINKIKRHILCFIVIASISLFLANKQRQHVIRSSASLVARYKMNPLSDRFVLSSNHSFFEFKHWDNAFHSFRKIFNLKQKSFSLGRQLYIDIYGYKRAELGKFPTWWPTPVSGFIYLCGYCGIFIGSFFMATLLFFMEYIFRKSNLIIYSCVSCLFFKIYEGWVFNWFLISGLIPLSGVCLISKLAKNKSI